jgi:hypothetical protein
MRHPGAEVRKECITKNGLSVTKAARILHVDRQTLSNLLNGRSGMSPKQVESGTTGLPAALKTVPPSSNTETWR